MAKQKKEAQSPTVSVESLKLKLDDLINDCKAFAPTTNYPARYHNIAKVLQQVKRNNLR
jgi:hypothetical protein